MEPTQTHLLIPKFNIDGAEGPRVDLLRLLWLPSVRYPLQTLCVTNAVLNLSTLKNTAKTFQEYHTKLGSVCL